MTTPAVGSDNRTALSLYGIVYNTIYSIRRGGARAKILQKLSRRYAEKQRKTLILPLFSLFYMIFPYFNKILYIVYIEKK